MYVKKETGEEVTDGYAKRYPHLVKKVRAPKAVEAQAEIPAKASDAPSVEGLGQPISWTPFVGEMVEHNGEIIAITNLEPLEATVYRREGGVQTTNDYPLESLDGVKPIDIQEAYRRVF